ncbi:hypothetical protein NDU88_002783 [Pleurodeles waltl]|uniref:Uncharacterized protein n=1 Tax=Pleurodeles waltl TaxID=8319 RepID=A0AAV7Q7P4_PLEWA|nr:hypothetical protein NDU88_002783 [Pleurodeles waltl]
MTSYQYKINVAGFPLRLQQSTRTGWTKISTRGNPGALRGGTFPKKRSVSRVSPMKRADKGHRKSRRVESRGKVRKGEAKRKKTRREKTRDRSRGARNVPDGRRGTRSRGARDAQERESGKRRRTEGDHGW